jgi:hypothetical protein
MLYAYENAVNNISVVESAYHRYECTSIFVIHIVPPCALISVILENFPLMQIR